MASPSSPAQTPPTSPALPLKLNLLGEISATWQGERLAVSAPRMLGLLAYLHLHGPTPRSELLEVFWPRQGAQAVRQALYTLRSLAGAEQWLSHGAEVSLRAQSDVTDLRAELGAGKAEALTSLVRAGPLLGSLNVQGAPAFAEWLEEQRLELQTELLAGLRRRAQELSAAQNYPAARECLNLRLNLDPLDESTYRDLMRLEHGSGHYAEALEVFERLRQTLRIEVGVEPEPATLALLQELEGHDISGQNRARLLGATDLAGLELDPLFGRETEQEQLALTLQKKGRALVQGMAGMGKTRLAWAELERHLGRGQAAQEQTAQGQRAQSQTAQRQTALWLELGADPPEVLRPALGEGLGLRGELTRADLHRALRQHGVSLIVLDNAANTYALGRLLEDLPAELPVLVTSRLRLPRLPTLSLHRLSRADSLALMGGAHVPPADPNLDALCAVLGDHPYALRLAAITLQRSGQSAGELLQALQDAPHTLGEDRSIKALLQQSLSGLDAESYEAYLGLGSLFTPQATPELLALALRRSPDQTEQALYNLTAHGLTIREAKEGRDQISYRMHELTWQDAKAHAALQAKTVMNAVRDYARSYTASPEHLYAELPNLIGAAQQAAKAAPDVLVGIMAGWVGKGYITARGFPVGYMDLLGQAAAQTAGVGRWEQASLLQAKIADIQHSLLRDFEQAIGSYLQAADSAKRAGQLAQEAHTTALAGALQAMSHLPAASATLAQAHALAQQSGDTLCLCRVLQQQGIWQAMQKRFEDAYALLSEARRRLLPLLSGSAGLDTENFDDVQAFYGTLIGNLGQASLRLGHYPEALALKRESLALAEERGELFRVARSQADIGEILLLLERPEEARPLVEAALKLFQEIGATGQETEMRQLLEKLPPLA
ncbi:hypothetical protein Dxin01_02985 [Deinococcus xinjiangensis]|uniref:Bacterial transcriptional activator domain-containing protein n=1 Tax=Deinococcus xinjiangensis TaxID=457454 RepID=A0ABP9VF83_9DEIO